MKSSNEGSGRAAPVRHYIDLDPALSQKLNVLAAQMGQTKKQIIESLVNAHLKAQKNG